MLTWRYAEQGHVELWSGTVPVSELTKSKSDRYLQREEDVEALFDSIG